jgi:hypothetical protein
VFLDIMLSGFTASVVADAERERNELPVRDFV